MIGIGYNRLLFIPSQSNVINNSKKPPEQDGVLFIIKDVSGYFSCLLDHPTKEEEIARPFSTDGRFQLAL